MRKRALFLAIFTCIMSFASLRPVYAANGSVPCPPNISSLDCTAIRYDWAGWVPDSGDSACKTGGGTTSLVGKDNEQKTWNFFKGKGLDDMHVAAIMGNISVESGFMPDRIQSRKGQKGILRSNDPNAAGDLGWGLSQWTPGKRIYEIADRLNVKGAVYELSTQLEVIWGEYNSLTPTSHKGFLKGFLATKNLSDAVHYYSENYEGAGIFGDRVNRAQSAYDRYGNGSVSAPTSSGCEFQSADCQSAQGSAKIICAAEKYDIVSYIWGDGHAGGAKWHSNCKTLSASCGLDCSGLVNIAVYDAFHVDLMQNTASERAAIGKPGQPGKTWQRVTLDKVQPGDLIQPNEGHVEIIDSIQGNTINTFGAHTSKAPQPQQVGPAKYKPSAEHIYLHYIGPGSDS